EGMFGGIFGSEMPGHMVRMMGGGVPGGLLRVSMQLSDGSWLNFRTPFVPLQPFWSSGYFLWFLVLTLGVLAVSVWAVKRASSPLSIFARASERLGRDVNAPPISEEGPDEVRKAAAAFNTMQRSLRRFVDDRTQMLAAISHDLRTPITRLKLRAELIEDETQKNKFLSDLDEMESMISSTLSFARDEAAIEEATSFDLAVMLQDLCEDMAETGADIRYVGLDHAPYTGKPVALKRAIGNLAGNAVTYGESAEVVLHKTATGIEVSINDKGPGIPEDQMEKVFTPFYRLEQSRSRETGGVGLGLSVVRSIVHAHGGEVTLKNRAEGGLRVTITLPNANEAATSA
ncbi:MAG: ATP-binding protein, partial [Rhodospirillales bacterium]|nr:ATP-binding protein [Rhodospirillales bacterium]